MQVSLPALKAFESAARLDSFKAAAQELSITPTAVSHHIKNLEQRLSVSLFVRETRKVILTDAGKELAEATHKGFEIIDAALKKIAMKEKQIDVTTTSSFAALVLIPRLREFSLQYPDITVNITSGERVEPSNYVLPIRFGECKNRAGNDVLKREQFNLFCSASTVKRFNEPEPLTIYTTSWKNRDLPKVPWQLWLTLNGLHEKGFNLKHFDQELFSIQQAMLENTFVFCSRTLVQGYIDAGVLVELDTNAIASSLCYYIDNKDSRLSRHNVVFVEWLEKLLDAS
ncbi:LysR family transcriptional regulator [Alteromonas sp. KUL42]|uniref:LysR family transcriptional regulator n=1 Tax=Alteromonas sp. KUL42 TaxID=2480797 RepID=UPI00079A3DAF|nr:LysR family transcriptional regulator [Alteromonas sp. KUL42]KXJ61328.1 MAG: LysR family transcriptional regulator [Alteromonas sp. Nap_26]TAP37174.1 LysR family transcriptional regulator [Alteromonas sp. KUL42]GEA06601.1 LysR family transcriptional regulator [Alteromonas sp. KUL42]